MVGTLCISFVITSEELDPSSFSTLWKLELGHMFVTSHMLHVWLRGAAVRTATDTFCPAAMFDPLEEAVRHGVSHSNSELVKAL